MGKKRKRGSNRGNTREIVYIPEEVITQILVKLPVTTLLRFRCVCKSWRSIIDSPDFVELHGNRFDSTKLIAFEGLGHGGHSGCLLTLRKSDSLRKIATVFKISGRYKLEGRCDSLLLLRFDSDYRMRICNPSIRKSLLLPPCPLVSDFRLRYTLGFARQVRDYKIIAYAFDQRPHVAVYTLNDRRWVVRDNALSTDYKSFPYFSNYCYFEGAAHWIRVTRSKPNHIGSLDFDTEKVTISELPPSFDETDSLMSLFLVRGSLAVLCVSPVITRIWLLKQKESESGNKEWVLWFSGRLRRNELMPHLNKYSVYISVLYHEGTGGGYLIFGKVFYNIATGQLHVLGKSMTRHLKLRPYCESLVLCNGFETEDMTSPPFVLHK